MKTIQDMKRRLAGLLDDADQYKNTKPPKKLTAEIQEVRQLIRYLETKPTEEMVFAQITEVRRKLDFRPKRYKAWYACLPRKQQNLPYDRLKALFNKEHEVPKLRAQLQTLNKLF